MDDDDVHANATRSPDRAMDRWLQQQLRMVYDDTVNEPLPRELLDLVEKIGRRSGQI
jgi:hypothetical protein